jgi:hypothetical protein
MIIFNLPGVAAEPAFLAPPQYVGPPQAQHAVTHRAFQGIPNLAGRAVSARADGRCRRTPLTTRRIWCRLHVVV